MKVVDVLESQGGNLELCDVTEEMKRAHTHTHTPNESHLHHLVYHILVSFNQKTAEDERAVSRYFREVRII